MPLELYPFRYRDPLTGKWVRARYVAERHVIAERYAEWEILGPPEIRAHGDHYNSFNPFRGQSMRVAHAPINETPPVEQRSIDDQLERFLVLLFLRRYVTYCARRGRFAAMNGAAMLYRRVRSEP
jgi:hypothetical protein